MSKRSPLGARVQPGPHDVFGERLRRGDLTLLGAIYPPGVRGDPATLLALHAACREARATFAYLEIGSHLGASLQSYVADPRCTEITSIDPRPESQPDDRIGTAHYAGNSTERMLEHLRRVPGANLGKLRTLEASSEELSRQDVSEAPALCFIDGEHTRAAALRDARFCREVMGAVGAIVFHDRRIVASGIGDFVEELAAAGADYSAYPLASEIFVVELGTPALAGSALVRARRPASMRALWCLATALAGARGARAFLLAEAAAGRLAGRVKRLVTAPRSRRGRQGR